MDIEPLQQSSEEESFELRPVDVGEAPPQPVPMPSTLHMRDMLWFSVPTGAGVILYAWAIYKLML